MYNQLELQLEPANGWIGELMADWAIFDARCQVARAIARGELSEGQIRQFEKILGGEV